MVTITNYTRLNLAFPMSGHKGEMGGILHRSFMCPTCMKYLMSCDNDISDKG